MQTDPNATSTAAATTRTGYDQWSHCYDADDNPLVTLEQPVLRRLIDDVRGLDVLDVGCGTGRHTGFLAAAGARVTAIDFSPGMLEQARAKPECRGVDFRAHDLSQPLPFADASFDKLICGLVIDHIADLGLLMAQMRRVCRPGGSAAVSVMHPAMSLIGVQARFTDPATGNKVLCGSENNRCCDYVMAIVRGGWTITGMSEYQVDEQLILQLPRAAKYRGWPMLLAFGLSA